VPLTGDKNDPVTKSESPLVEAIASVTGTTVSDDLVTETFPLTPGGMESI
jgi:hypothetical protein